MKKLLSIIGLFLMSVNLFAQGSLLKFREENGRRIAVEINGRMMQYNGRVVTVNNMPAGQHRIRVFILRGPKRQLVYNGRMNVRPNNIYRCTVENYSGLDILEYCCLNNNGNYTGNMNGFYFDDPDWDDQYWDGHHHDYGWHNNGGWNNSNNHDGLNYYNGNNGSWNNGNNGGWNNNNNGSWNNGNNGSWNNNNNGSWNNGNNGAGDNYWGMPNQAMMNTNFEAFKRTVENAKFDSGKMDLIRAQMKDAWITAQQLRDLVSLFSFESSKLDMAKFGANHVVDRQNLFSIYDVFSFESSKSEFATFISNLK
jgi:hypothetical protein